MWGGVLEPALEDVRRELLAGRGGREAQPRRRPDADGDGGGLESHAGDRMPLGRDDAVLRGPPAAVEDADGHHGPTGHDRWEEGGVQSWLQAQVAVEDGVPRRCRPARECGERGDAPRGGDGGGA